MKLKIHPFEVFLLSKGWIYFIPSLRVSADVTVVPGNYIVGVAIWTSHYAALHW